MVLWHASVSLLDMLEDNKKRYHFDFQHCSPYNHCVQRQLTGGGASGTYSVNVSATLLLLTTC